MEEEKQRYETLLQDERDKYKKKESEWTKFVDELKQRHKEELYSYDDKNKSIIHGLSDDNKKIRIEIDREIQNERERLGLLHKSDIENQENIAKRNLEQQKKFYEEQNETLKKQLQQQIEFNKLANKMKSSQNSPQKKTKQLNQLK